MTTEMVEEFPNQLYETDPDCSGVVTYTFLKVYLGTSLEHSDGVCSSSRGEDKLETEGTSTFPGMRILKSGHLEMDASIIEDPRKAIEYLRSGTARVKILAALSMSCLVAMDGKNAAHFTDASLVPELLKIFDIHQISAEEIRNVRAGLRMLVEATPRGARAYVKALSDPDPRLAFGATAVLSHLLVSPVAAQELDLAGLVPVLVRNLAHTSPFVRGASVFAFSDALSRYAPQHIIDEIMEEGYTAALLRLISNAHRNRSEAVEKEHGVFINFSWGFRDSYGNLTRRLMSDVGAMSGIFLGQLVQLVPTQGHEALTKGGPEALMDALKRAPEPDCVAHLHGIRALLAGAAGECKCCLGRTTEQFTKRGLFLQLMQLLRPELAWSSLWSLQCAQSALQHAAAKAVRPSELEESTKLLLKYISAEKEKMQGSLAVEVLGRLCHHFKKPFKIVSEANPGVRHHLVCTTLLHFQTGSPIDGPFAFLTLLAATQDGQDTKLSAIAVRKGAVQALLRVLQNEAVRDEFTYDNECRHRPEGNLLDSIRTYVFGLAFKTDPSILPQALECGLVTEMECMMTGPSMPMSVMSLLAVQSLMVNVPKAVQKLRDAGIVPNGIASVLIPGQDWPVVEEAARALKAVCKADPACIEEFNRFNTLHMLVLGLSCQIPSREIHAALQAALDCLSGKGNSRSGKGKPAPKPVALPASVAAEPSASTTQDSAPGERKAGHAAGHAKPSGTHRTPTYAPENGTKKLANTSAEDGSNSTDTGSTKKGGTDVTVADPVPKSDSHTGPGTDKVCSTGPDAVCVPPGAAGAKNGNWQKQGADTESTKLGTERLKGKVKAARKKEQGDEQSTKVHACALCGATSKKDPAVRLKACGRCNLVMYCGKKCQSEDWPSHKRECKSVKVAEK